MTLLRLITNPTEWKLRREALRPINKAICEYDGKISTLKDERLRLEAEHHAISRRLKRISKRETALSEKRDRLVAVKEELM
mgnify:CR=1 FL=1